MWKENDIFSVKAWKITSSEDAFHIDLETWWQVFCYLPKIYYTNTHRITNWSYHHITPLLYLRRWTQEGEIQLTLTLTLTDRHTTRWEIHHNQLPWTKMASIMPWLITVNSTSIKAFRRQCLIYIHINQGNCACLKVFYKFEWMVMSIVFEQQHYDELL